MTPALRVAPLRDHAERPGGAAGPPAFSDWNPARALALVTTPTRAGLLAEIEARLAARQGFSVATLNLDHMVKLRGDPAFRDAYVRHSHVVADGNPVVWLSRLAGRPVELVPGSELVQPLAAIAARHDVPVALMGSTDAALAAAADRLQAAHPGLRVVARIAPGFGFDPDGAEAEACIEALEACGARLCLIALGAPRQERFAVRAAARLGQTGFVSVGAGLDFIAGTQRRAPGWVRRISMEWAWRMLNDPVRLTRRYAACFAILPELTRAARKAGSGNS